MSISNGKKKSWRTTAAGALAAIAVLVAGLSAYFEGGLEAINIKEIMTALGGLAVAFGLYYSRDDSVSSEGRYASKDLDNKVGGIGTGASGSGGSLGNSWGGDIKPPSFLLFFAMLIPLSGCGALSPTQQYALTSDTYSATLRGIVLASRLGKISFEDMQEVKKVRDQLNGVMDDWETALVEGRDLDAAFYFQTAQKLLDKINRAKLKANRKPATPTGGTSNVERTSDNRNYQSERRSHSIRFRAYASGPGRAA